MRKSNARTAVRIMWVVAILLSVALRGECAIVATDLRCEYLSNPLVVEAPACGGDDKGVRLSWIVEDGGRIGAMQGGYEIEVASGREALLRGDADIWRSGFVKSGRSASIHVKDRHESFGRRWWRVRLTDEQGRKGEWSLPASWRYGAATPADWEGARWIALKPLAQWEREWKAQKAKELPHLSESGPIRSYGGWNLWEILDSVGTGYDSAPMFRREFSVGKDVTDATLYICGLGYFEASLNGERVGEDVLNPAWTVFDDKALYSVYDVMPLLRKGGKNAIGVTLGRGQLNPICNDAWGFSRSRWVSEPRLVAMLRMEHADGSVSTLVSDGNWRVAEGPTVFDDTRLGEVYDARRETPGWDTPGFDDSRWAAASMLNLPLAPLQPQLLPPVRRHGGIAPRRTWRREGGILLCDLGENIAGWARVKVRGERGKRVLVEYCEMPSDTQLVANLHPAREAMSSAVADRHWGAFHDATTEVRQQNGYILRGEGEEEFECRFSYKGFRYVRLTADSGVTVEGVEGVPVHSDVESVGHFHCSDSTINSLQEIATRTLKNNLTGIPTDCPHREKLGWTADGYFTAGAAMYNFNMAQFYRKWMQDLGGSQGEGGAMCTVAPSVGYDLGMSVSWPAALMYVPSEMYDFYGERPLLEELYGTMERFCDHAREHELPDSPELMREVLGDWVSPADSILPGLRGSSILAPPEGVNTYGASSYYSILRHMERIATILGRDEDSGRYAAWAERVRGDFNRRFLCRADSCYYGHIATPYREAPNAVALMEGIVPEDSREAVAGRLMRELSTTGYKARTGFLGTRAMMRWLPTWSAEGAFRVAIQPEYPGWGYMVAQGATTMWEDWASCASVDHTPYCLISEYFYRHLAGITLRHDAEGVPMIEIAPQFVSQLDHATGIYRSLYGLIESSWERRGDGIHLTVEIPANCTASLNVDGLPSTLPSGRHTFRIKSDK